MARALSSIDELVVGQEEEAEHVAALAQQLDPCLDEGGSSAEDLLLPYGESVEGVRRDQRYLSGLTGRVGVGVGEVGHQAIAEVLLPQCSYLLGV